MTALHLGHRLHGARLAAGFVFLTDVADLLSVNHSTYRHAESNIRPANDGLVRRASELFGVTIGYLQDGNPASDADAFAGRLARIVSDSAAERFTNPKVYLGMLDRLREIRIANGFDTINAAADGHNWNRTVYWQHETGGRGITLDRMIAYCLSMGARPEYGVMGEKPLEETAPPEWRERPRRQGQEHPIPSRAT